MPLLYLRKPSAHINDCQLSIFHRQFPRLQRQVSSLLTVHTLTKPEIQTAQPTQPVQVSMEGLFDQSNQLTSENKSLIMQFLSGNRNNPNPEQGPVRQIQLNLEEKTNTENV